MAPPKMSFTNWKPAAAREGFDADLAVAELAVASALLLVAAVACRGGANGLAVGDLGGFERDFGVVAAAEFGDDGFDVELAGAGEEEVVGLGVAVEAELEIFFHELVEGGGELVFVGAGFGLDGVGHGGLGRGDGVDAEVVAADAEGVAGLRDAELGDDTEVAGMELGDFDELAALHDADVGEALGLGAGVVFERGFVADAAADDFEEGDAAGEGVDEGFVDVEGGGFGVGEGAEDGVVVLLRSHPFRR